MTRDPRPDGRVAAWRFERLIAAGFSKREALILARSGTVDLHAVLQLIDRGCPPWLAARIAAPLDLQLPRSI
jgi:hypothetical protein